MIETPEFWVAVAFFIFFGILGYFKVHKLMVVSIDTRAARISTEIAEATRLREEAEMVVGRL
jgi:F0F1-type ATP synthase, subunit b